MADEGVRILERRRVLDDVFKVDEVVLQHRRFDGSWSPRQRRLCFERGDSVAALLRRSDTGSLLLVEQFRYPTVAAGPGWITELVAGQLGSQETPESAMRREIREETGFTAAGLERLMTFYVSPGGTSERIILFYGEVGADDQRVEPGGVGTEDIRLVERDAAALRHDLRHGRIRDAKTIIALQWFFASH